MARGWRKSKKLGTKNKYQAARRDELAAAALAAAEAADRAAAAELLADLATQEDQQYASPQTVVKPKHNPLAAGQRARWRSMIIWKYVELGCPPKKQWEGRGGTVATISKWLEQSELADKRPILEVLTRYVSNEAQIKSRLGVQQKLTQGESNVAADALAAGHSKEMVGFIISEWRTKQGRTGKDAQISKKAIFTAFRNMGGVTSKRGTTSTGSRDPESAWAKSRLAQALQWKAQLVVPERVVAEATLCRTFTSRWRGLRWRGRRWRGRRWRKGHRDRGARTTEAPTHRALGYSPAHMCSSLRRHAPLTVCTRKWGDRWSANFGVNKAM
jgi:hypothetical protein